jgi:hypothetical protein
LASAKPGRNIRRLTIIKDSSMPKGVEFEQQCSYDAIYEQGVTCQSDENSGGEGCRNF